MQSAELEKAVIRGIIKGGLLLAVLLIALWYLAPFAFPLILAWAIYFFERVATNPQAYLKGIFFAAIFFGGAVGIPSYLAKKKLWIFKEENPRGVRLYIGMSKLFIFILIWVVGCIFLAAQWL